ncbi:MAG: 30S ribosomal protein S5 [uncultured bacterium]|nr:MAG: 30S ribosomal protein S5 [uncultured bacterium]
MINQYRQEDKEFQEKVVKIRRVSKKTTGGNYVTFSALVVVGNRKGRVGIGLGRSLEVPPAIQKAISYAKKHMINVPMRNKTIPHEIRVKFRAARILLKPAPEGTGLKVGSVTRVILDLAGVENASGKIIGSRNQIVNTYAIMKALSMLRTKF